MMTEEAKVYDIAPVEKLEVEENVEETELFDFVKSITLWNPKTGKKEYHAPESVTGRVYKQAVSLQYEEKKLSYKHDGKENYEKDEDGNLIPVPLSLEIEMKTQELYENLVVAYFHNQFTLEELQDGLDARHYQETLIQVLMSALGNRIVPVKKQK